MELQKQFNNNINYRLKVLQLCCFTNLWQPEFFHVESHDTKNGKDIFDLPDDYGKDFDIILSAPPCRQFTVANNRNWEPYPELYVNIAKKCYNISIQSGKPWIIENVIGRITTFLPELIQYRIGTWKSTTTTKKHLIFSNCLILLNNVDQTNNRPINLIGSGSNRIVREAYDTQFIETIQNHFINESTN
jgi:site-specific DNA-cytosine methylase